MNYLQLVQRAIKESGATLSAPSSVSGLTGLAEKFATWVAEAWREIQLEREDWIFQRQQSYVDNIAPLEIPYGQKVAPTLMDSTIFQDWKSILLHDVNIVPLDIELNATFQFTGSAVGGSPTLGQSYPFYVRDNTTGTPVITQIGTIFLTGYSTSVGPPAVYNLDGDLDVDFSLLPPSGTANLSYGIEYHAGWLASPEWTGTFTENSRTQTPDVSEVEPICYIPWSAWPETFGITDSALADKEEREITGTPKYFTINPEGDLWVHPIPDNHYRIEFYGYNVTQDLTDDADIPVLDEDLRMMIVWKAIMEYGSYHVDASALERGRSKYRPYKKILEDRYMPQVKFRTDRLYRNI